MKLIFTVRSISELSHLPSKVRDFIWHQCHPKAWKHWQTWFAVFVCLGLQVSGWYIASVGGHSLFHLVLASLLIVIGGGGFFQYTLRLRVHILLKSWKRVCQFQEVKCSNEFAKLIQLYNFFVKLPTTIFDIY